ncbi:MAG: beta-xylosidase [Anaerolineae bacterium]|nr:beta-xylosidase [Anaerolineae bacterium]
MTHQAHVRVHADQRQPLRRIWRYVGYDEVNYTYTPSGRALLTKLGSLHDAPYFIRAHYLLCTGDGTGRPKWGSTNVYTEDRAGQPVYEWDLIDRVFDTYLACGCVPFVELGFMPEALSTAPPGTPYETLRDGGWRYPPKDYRRWQDLVAALARHCLERYGLREVSRWYWELWNEPDIFYFAGTLEEYCQLYDHTVAGLTQVLPQARVGGPGTTNPDRPDAGAFLRGFLEHCVQGTNAVSGDSGTRLDFISFHTKGGGYRSDNSAPKQTPTIYQLVQNVVTGFEIAAAYPTLAGREVILTEADPDGWAAGSRHDNPNLEFRNRAYYASYVAMAACKFSGLGLDGPHRVDGMLTWAFEFEDRKYFEGLRTLSTNGIDKPVLNVFRFLARLGGLRLALESDAGRDPRVLLGPDEETTPPDVSGLAATDGQGGVQIFLVSHHDDWDVDEPTVVQVTVAGLDAGAQDDSAGSQPGARYRLVRSMIDETHSNAYTLWRDMGEPQAPSPEQIAALQRAAMPGIVEQQELIVEEGLIKLQVTLPAHSVGLIELSQRV